MNSNNTLPGIPFLLPLVWLGVILYGSFIPFNFQYIPLADAWASFKNTPFLNLGIGFRADWVANILLYIPAGFFSMGWASKLTHSSGIRFFLMLMVPVFWICILISIEFFQLFASPRTVSVNDLIAETAGTVLGIFLWFGAGEKLMGIWRVSASRLVTKAALNAIFILYLMALLAISLFPFDFLVSIHEIRMKLSALTDGSLLFSGSHTSTLRFLLKIIAETITFVPLGLFVGIRAQSFGGRAKFLFVFLLGVLFGFSLEFLQFFTASGVTEVTSVFTRGFGACLGLLLCYLAPVFPIDRIRPYIKPAVFLALPAYFIIMLRLNGWFDGNWISFEAGVHKFKAHMLIPFYYHYFTTETRALLSLLYNSVLYAPIGIAGGVFFVLKKEYSVGSIYLSVVCAMSLAVILEASKLLQRGMSPDFTNVIIAAASAYISFKLAGRTLSFVDERRK